MFGHTQIPFQDNVE